MILHVTWRKRDHDGNPCRDPIELSRTVRFDQDAFLTWLLAWWLQPGCFNIVAFSMVLETAPLRRLQKIDVLHECVNVLLKYIVNLMH